MAAGPVSTQEQWIWASPTKPARPPTATKTINRRTTINHQRKETTMPTTTRSKSQNSATESSPSDMNGRIINHIRAGYPGLYIVSPEEQRVQAETHQVAKELNYSLHFWSVVDGLVDSKNGQTRQANDPLEALLAIQDLKEKTIILLRDFHLFLADPNPILIRQFKDVLLRAKTQNKTLIILGCRLCLPPELEREITVIEFALPGKQQLGLVLDGIIESAQLKTIEGEQRDKILDAASGLTTIEAENAFALSVVESKAVDPAIVAREKASVVKKNSILRSLKPKNPWNPLAAWMC